jgi:TM2 domain-containing membrane protein YozV/YHS domain-containing protein
MAHICPVCNKKISIFEEEYSRSKFLHRDCVKEFESQPEKYIRKAEAPSNSEPSDKDFVITLLICVFLGGLGVHRFFVDKIGTGVLMLVTLGGLGLWWIIDIILIVTGSFKDSEGRVIAYQAAGTVNREPAKDIPAEIRKFAELKKDGLISEEEFDKKKEELLR